MCRHVIGSISVPKKSIFGTVRVTALWSPLYNSLKFDTHLFGVPYVFSVHTCLKFSTHFLYTPLWCSLRLPSGRQHLAPWFCQWNTPSSRTAQHSPGSGARPSSSHSGWYLKNITSHSGWCLKNITLHSTSDVQKILTSCSVWCPKKEKHWTIFIIKAYLHVLQKENCTDLEKIRILHFSISFYVWHEIYRQCTLSVNVFVLIYFYMRHDTNSITYP